MLVPWSYFSLDSCVSFLILSPYRTFGNSACLATLDSNVQSTNEFIKGILYFHYMFVKSPHSCLILCNTLDHSLPGSSNPGKNTGVGCSALLQGLSTQGLNPCLLCLLHWQVGSLPLVSPGKPSFHSTFFNTDILFWFFLRVFFSLVIFSWSSSCLSRFSIIAFNILILTSVLWFCFWWLPSHFHL